MSWFPRGFAFQNRCNFYEVSTWNFDVESMENRPRCVHWVKEQSNDNQKVSYWPQYAIIFPNLEVFIYPNVIKWGILAVSLWWNKGTERICNKKRRTWVDVFHDTDAVRFLTLEIRSCIYIWHRQFRNTSWVWSIIKSQFSN